MNGLRLKLQSLRLKIAGSTLKIAKSTLKIAGSTLKIATVSNCTTVSIVKKKGYKKQNEAARNAIVFHSLFRVYKDYARAGKTIFTLGWQMVFYPPRRE